MPSRKAHNKLAGRNRAVLGYLIESPEKCNEWIATVAFYTAVQVVEEMFTTDPAILHSNDHRFRERHLKKRKFADIWKHYRPLKKASMLARYLEEGTEKVVCFGNTYPHKNTISILVKHHLAQVEKAVRKRLDANSGKKRSA